MNLLAAGASFGVVTAIFQLGWGTELLGLGKAGPIEAFLPVIMLAILFGLSMDYQVFLVSNPAPSAEGAPWCAKIRRQRSLGACSGQVWLSGVRMVDVRRGWTPNLL